MTFSSWRVTTRPAKRRGAAAVRSRLFLDRLEDRVNPAPIVFSGAGTANATAQFAAYKAAIGGVDNANNGPQTSGFRTINWDGVGLGATDGTFTNEVITANHTVGIPLNRFQQRGMFFNDIYAVTDTSFTTENPGLQPPTQFPPFSGTKIFAMFNDNSIDFHFVQPSAPTTTQQAAATRGFGAIFLDVEKDNTTSVQYFHGDTLLGTYFVPSTTSTQPSFLGVLFDNPVVTSVTLTLGDGVLFSFDGTTVTPGAPDLSISGTTDQVATDDFVYPEPVPVTGLMAAAKATNGSTVNVYSTSGTTPTFVTSFEAYPGFAGGVSVATADVNGDGVPDVITGAGPGGGPHVKVFDGASLLKGQTVLLESYFAYDASFPGGVDVSTGDVFAKGVPSILTGAGPGGGPHVKVFNGSTGALQASFFAYDPSFAGGVNVAAGDLNGDGLADVVTGAGPGGGPHVKVFDATKLNQIAADGQLALTALLSSFFAYAPSFAGGVHVAAGDVNGDGIADVVTGAGPGAAPHVVIFNGAQLEVGTIQPIASFFPYAVTFPGGVNVAVADLNGDGKDEVLTGAGPGGGPHVEIFNIAAGSLAFSFFPFDLSFTGGVVAAADV
jgi:hypothetical protein